MNRNEERENTEENSKEAIVEMNRTLQQSKSFFTRFPIIVKFFLSKQRKGRGESKKTYKLKHAKPI